MESFHGTPFEQINGLKDELTDSEASKLITDPAMPKTIESTENLECTWPDLKIQESIVNIQINEKSLSNLDLRNEIKASGAEKEKLISESPPVSNLIYRNKAATNMTHTPNSNSLPTKKSERTKQNSEKTEEISPTLNEESKRLSILSNLRSPSSPLPHFPAIGVNDINEHHQNYTVIRSGEIIEKNGTYYSTDGTVRGYSGTVKKITNSQTLTEIFAKQKELEQEREKEFEIQQQIKRETDAQKKNSMSNNLKQRVSLGNIILNEKNFSSISKLPSSKTSNSLSNKRHSDTIKPAGIENELSKKLEDRRQLIATQIAAENSNNNNNNNIHLKVDTNLRQIPSGANSIISSASSNSFTISSDISNPSLMSPKSPRTAFDSQTTSLTSFSYDLNANRNLHQQKSPSFVISAKNKIHHGSKSLSDDINQNKNNLLNELKMTVPLIDSNNNKLSKTDIIANSSSLITLAVSQVKKEPENSQIFGRTAKYFNDKPIRSLDKKSPIENNRSNLMDSIKGFSMTNLRKTDT